MKKLENLLLGAAGYTVLILLLFYIFGTLSNFANPYIDFRTFLVILGFGVIISLAGMILGIQKIHVALRVLIHYVALLIAFFTVFIINGNISAQGAGWVFVAIVLFTVFYLLIAGITILTKKLVGKIDSNIGTKTEAECKKEGKYKPLYKLED